LTGPKIAEEFEVTIEQGKTLHFKTLAQSEDLNANGEREVFFELNGQLRSVYVRDNKCSSNGTPVRPKADPTVEGQLGAPMKGDVVDVKISVGDRVEKGQVVAVLSAMKMEMAVQAPIEGKISAVHVAKGNKVDGDDLIIEIE